MVSLASAGTGVGVTSTTCVDTTGVPATIFVTSTTWVCTTVWGWQALRSRLAIRVTPSRTHVLLLSIFSPPKRSVRSCDVVCSVWGIEFGRTAERPPPFTDHRRTDLGGPHATEAQARGKHEQDLKPGGCGEFPWGEATELYHTLTKQVKQTLRPTRSWRPRRSRPGLFPRIFTRGCTRRFKLNSARQTHS